jgi:CRP/FNR family transcriptional regulator, dissimilatory nitrate respiration regulator
MYKSEHKQEKILSVKYKDFVENTHLFKGLDEQQMEKVLMKSSLQKLKKEQGLFSQDDPFNRFYIVRSGMIKLFRLSPDGQEKVIEVVNEGESFAEALMFLDSPHFPVSAAALSEAEVISFDAVEFIKMLKQSPETCLTLLGSMSQRIRGLVQEIDNLSVQTGRQRLSAYLLELSADSDKLHLPVPKSVLASRLSIKPETFSRIIKQLRNSETILVNGADFEIVDRDQLEDFAMV